MMLRWSWGGVGWDVNVHVYVTLVMLRWSWGGEKWNINVHVHVTLMMLRWSWGGVGWDVNVHVHVPLMMLRWSWGGVRWDVNVHVHVTVMMFCWSWGGVGWGGMLTFMFMFRWWCYVDHGVGWGGMLTFMFMLRWNCSMVEVVFEKWKNRCARLHAQLHWEVHADPLKTTTRLCRSLGAIVFYLYTCVSCTPPGSRTPWHTETVQIVSGIFLGETKRLRSQEDSWLKKKNNRSWRTGINHDKSWFKVSTCAASMAIQGPESQTSEPGIKAACHGRQLSSGSMVISWSTFSQGKPWDCTRLHVVCRSWKSPNQPVWVLSGDQYNVHHATSTQLWGMGHWDKENVLIVIFRNLWYSTSSTSLSSSPISRCLTAIDF